MVIKFRNALVGILLLVLMINSKCHTLRISDKPTKFISLYSLPSSKFQAKDVLDSMVYHDSSLSYRKLTDYIDTFILERTVSIIYKSDSDSVEYHCGFSGDVKEWITNTDSSYLGLLYLYINGKTYEAEKFKQLPKTKQDKYLTFFKKKIIDRLYGTLMVLPKYSISIIDTTKNDRIEGKALVCKHLGNCDTIFLKYLDGGLYTGIKKPAE